MITIWETTTDNGDDLGLYTTHDAAIGTACEFINDQTHWTEEERATAIEEIKKNDGYDGVVYVRERTLWDVSAL